MNYNFFIKSIHDSCTNVFYKFKNELKIYWKIRYMYLPMIIIWKVLDKYFLSRHWKFMEQIGHW